MNGMFYFLTAFISGIFSFFSPCILPLIPSYLCFITGLSTKEILKSKKTYILIEIILFVFGFSLIFILLGSLSFLLGSFLIENKKILNIISGLIIIFLGIHITGILNINFLQFEKKFHLKNKPINKFGSFLVGIVFALGWTPCVGPILGSILMMCAKSESLVYAIILLSFYSLGLALPFFFIGIGINYTLNFFSKIKKYFKLISIISGTLFIIIGIKIIFGG